MALQRYSSQVVTENRPVYADAGAFRYSNVDSQVMGNLGQELGQVANVADQMTQVQKRLDEKYQNHIDSLQMAKASDALQASSALIDEIYETNNDTTQWEGLTRREIEKATGNIRPLLSSMSPQAREFAEQNMKQFGDMQTIKMRTLRAKTASQQDYVYLMAAYENAVGTGNQQQADVIEQEMDSKWQDWFGREDAYKLAKSSSMSKGMAAYKKASIESLKPLIVGVLGDEYNKELGYQTLNAATDQLVKEGILNEAEAADANKDIGDWMDMYVEGRKSAKSKEEKLTIQQTYDAFIPKLLDGSLTADDVEQSSFTEKTKEHWKTAMMGSYQEAPKETKYDSLNETLGAAFAYSAGALSKQDAIDQILKARYIDQGVMDSDFAQAIKRIAKPYPEYVAANMRSVLGTVSVQEAGLVYFSKQEKSSATKIARILTKWVDKQLDSGKEPTAEEMGQIVAQAKSGVVTIEQIGDIMTLGDRKYEVVGFDRDGTPMMELID